MRSGHSRLAVVLLVVPLLVMACGRPAADGDGPIRIGVIADLTGPFAVYGTSLVRSAEIAVEEINTGGGVLGRQLALLVEDTQTDVAVTVDRARALVERDRVNLVLGPIGSDANDAAFQVVVVEGRRILMYPETYEGGKCHPLFFSTGAVPEQQIGPLLEHLHAEYGPRALLFGADYVWPRRSFEIAAPIVEGLGGEVVSTVYLPLVADDFLGLVAAVRAAAPDYIFALYPAAWGAALKALDDAGLLQPGLGIGTTFLGDADLAGIGALAAGNVTALPFFTSVPGDGVERFLSAFEDRFGPGAIPNGGESMGAYNGVHLFARAVEQAGTTDQEAVAAALRVQRFDGPTGEVRMTESGHLRQPIQMVVVNEAGRHEFLRTVSDREPEQACP